MMSLNDAFEPARSALESAGVRYAAGGSWAATAFGEPRFTMNFIPRRVSDSKRIASRFTRLELCKIRLGSTSVVQQKAAQ